VPGKVINNDKTISTILEGSIGFLLPLLYMIFRIVNGISIARVGLEAAVIVIILNLLNSEKRMSPEKIFNAFSDAIDRGMVLVSTIGACGILIGVITITGVAFRFSSILMELTSFSAILTIIFVMVINIFLGLASNVISAYLLTAVICAPVLIRFGFEPLSVHMFILFFSITATITPPVAVTAVTAASIAESSYFKVSLQAMKLAAIAFIIPFAFIFNPAILLIGHPTTIALAILYAFVGVYIVSYGANGFWFNVNLNLPGRIFISLIGIMLLLSEPVYAALLFLISLIGNRYSGLLKITTKRRDSIENEK
jgi:TRAP-type uncharacterized transport system fused permease subunit